MRYKIIRSVVSLGTLQEEVNTAAAEGYRPSGAPFWNQATGEWLQAVFRDNPGSAEVRLREKGGKR